MDLVDLEHPETGGTCSVPQSTAENLIRHGGWLEVVKNEPAPDPPAWASPPEPDIPGDGEEDPES